MIIGLTGKMGSGKGEVAAYLEKKGFKSYRFSDIIREECAKRGIDPSRENLQIVGNKLREESGNSGILAKILREKADGNTVVDGIRNRKEIEELRKAEKFVLISVEVDPKLRFERMGTRSREGDPVSFEEWWNQNKGWYENKNITKEDFQNYRFKNGFNRGDIMVLRGKQIKDIESGDVIVFRSKRPDPIIHRVVKKWEEDGKYYVQTKGDNNNYSIKSKILDETRIENEQIIGKALFRVPFLGYIKIWFVDLLKLMGVMG